MMSETLLSIDEKAAASFVSALCGKSGACFQTFDDSEQKRPHLARILFGKLETTIEQLKTLNAHGAGVYMTINGTDGRGRKTENITDLRALFIDLDGKPLPTEWTIFPNMIVQTSGEDHCHVYWILNTGEDLSRFTEAQKHLAKYYGSDPKVCDLSRVMRIPGFYHQKGDPVLSVLKHYDMSEYYTIDQVLEMHPIEGPASEVAASPQPIHAAAGSASPAARARAYIQKMDPAVSGRGGHSQTLKVARVLVNEFSLPEHEAWPLLLEYNTRCLPPWSEKELRHKLDEALKLTAGGNNNRPKGALLTAPKASSSSATQSTPQEWREPMSLATAENPPPFPAGILPDWLEVLKDDVARSLEVPTDLPGICALGVLATCFQKRFVVKVNQSYTEPLSLDLVCGLEPGSRKSAVFSLFMNPVNTWEFEKQRKLEPIITEKQRQKAAIQRKITTIQGKLCLKNDTVGWEEELRMAHKEDDAIQIPIAPKLTVGDVTPEALSEIMAIQGGRITVASSEAAFFNVLMGRYNDSPAVEICLQGHAGEMVKINRASKDKFPVNVRAAAVSIICCIQPGIISNLSRDARLAGNGMLSRIVFVMPKSTLGYRKHEEPEIRPEYIQAYRQNILGMLDIEDRFYDGTNEIKAWEIPCDEDVRTLLTKFKKDIEPELREGGSLRDHAGYLSGFAGKLCGLALRVAGLLSLADGAESVSESHFVRGMRFAEYAMAHAKIVSRMVSTDPATETAKRILAGIERHNLRTFKLRDICNRLRILKKDTKEPLRLLVEHEFIRGTDGASEPTAYEVNPAVFKND